MSSPLAPNAVKQLSTLPEPGHELLWAAMLQLVDRLGQAVDRQAVTDECLDILIDTLGADRGLVLLGDASSAAGVVNARTEGRSLRADEREEISRTVIQRVRSGGASVLYRPLEEAGGSASVRELGIITALAAPLRAFGGGEAIGVLYLDFRSFMKRLGPKHLAFLDAAAMLIASAVSAERRLESTKADLRAAQERSPWIVAPPSLEELLRPSSLDRARREVRTALAGESPILITGESGTGKTLLAQAIAEASGRMPVVRATLGHSDDLNTITSELFGHERGSFSGAHDKRRGVVDYADGGTLVLDEILNLPKAAQQLLLDFTQFGTFRPLGYSGATPKTARVRIIAATNGDLQAAINEGRFRQDLYYRLAGVVLRLPALRERREDVPFLAESFLRRRHPSTAWRLSVQVRRLLASPALNWPGNIRQLESALQRACDRARADDLEASVLHPEHFDPMDLSTPTLEVPAPAQGVSGASLCEGFQIEAEELGDTWRRLERERETLGGLERQVLQLALTRNGGVVAKAARALGMPRTSLASRLQSLGLK